MMDSDTTLPTGSTDPEATGDADTVEAFGDEYERAPPDFEADFDTSDAEVPAHPVKVHVEGKGEAAAHLVSEGDVEAFGDEYGDEAEDLGAEAFAELLRQHYVSPSFDDLTAEDIRNSPAGYYERFLTPIAPFLFEGN